MCCLGFYAKACDIPDEHLIMILTTSGVEITHKRNIPKQMSWLQNKEGLLAVSKTVSNDACILMNMNDKDGLAMNLPIQTRKEKIKEIFEKQGINVIFETK